MTTTNHVIDRVGEFLAQYRPEVARALTIKPIAIRGKSGRRARRAAFYHRARMCRFMQRIARAGFEAQSQEIQLRFTNALVYGTSHPEMMLP